MQSFSCDVSINEWAFHSNYAFTGISVHPTNQQMVELISESTYVLLCLLLLEYDTHVGHTYNNVKWLEIITIIIREKRVARDGE